MKKTIIYLTVGLALFGLPFIAYTSEEYVGAKKCKTCHIKIYKKWQQASHSDAYTILSPGARSEEKKKAGLDPDKDYSCID